MNIEFHTPYKMVSEKLVNEIRKEILELSHINKNISRAEVFLKNDETIILAENKICEIRLNIYGSNLFAHTRTENFESSAREAIKELKKKVKQQSKKLNEPADEVTSTVKV
jgi:putative sigma-54 modulation protein